jgi:hypothetical protein
LLRSLCVYLTPRLVTHGNVCRPPESCFPIWVYHLLPTPLTKPNAPCGGEVQTPTKHYRILCSRSESHWWFWIGLPTVTSLRIWLEPGRWRPLPIITTAAKGLGIDQSVAGIQHQVAGWATVIRVDRVENRTHTQTGLNGGGRYRKDFQKKYFLVGIAFNEHGGKTGRAMIKYPHIQKNAQRKNTPLYPGLTTVSLDRIITYMQYYYVMCQKGPVIHRCYVLLDSESADVLHDSLEQRYDLVQVCDVRRSEVDPDILIK